METKWHRETVEALGMHAKKPRILNKLNAVATHSDDQRLRKLAESLISEILSTSTNTEVMAPKDMVNGVPSARKTLEYCKSLAYRD